jgi:hypothetical protein
MQLTSSHDISLKSSLILFYLCLGFSNGLFSSSFPTKMVWYMPAHLILHDLVTVTVFGEAYKL